MSTTGRHSLQRYALRLALNLIGMSLFFGVVSLVLADAFSSPLLLAVWWGIGLVLWSLVVLTAVNTLLTDTLTAYHRLVHDDSLDVSRLTAGGESSAIGDEVAASQPPPAAANDEWHAGGDGFEHKRIGERSRGTLVAVRDETATARFFVQDGDITPESPTVRASHDDAWLTDASAHLRDVFMETQ